MQIQRKFAAKFSGHPSHYFAKMRQSFLKDTIPSVRLVCLAIAIASAAVVGCSGSGDTSGSADSSDGSADAAAPITIQLNWFPEAEHGGVYAASVSGLYKDAGLNVTIRPGGQGTRIAAELETGRAQFAFANADDVALFRQAGVDAVAVLAAMQNHPRCILVRSDSGVEKIEDLKGMILQRQPGRPFVTFLEKNGYLNGVQQVPYNGSVAALASDPKVAIQAYSFAEPLLAKQQGIDVKTLMVSDLGWNPYSSVLVTTGTMIREQPELVRKVVEASQKGWREYLTSPDSANQAILKDNEHGMTAEVLKFGYDGLTQLAIPEGWSLDRVGQMDAARWEQLVTQMTELGIVEADKVSANDCFTNEFLLPAE